MTREFDLKAGRQVFTKGLGQTMKTATSSVFSTPSAASPPNRLTSNSTALDEWSFAIDSTTGNVYFYNRRTRETRWTLPGEEVATSLISSLSTAHSIMKKVEQEEEERRTRPVRAETSRDERLLPLSDTASANTSATTSGEEGKENVIKEAIDPHTGRKYYYDAITRQSFWEDPRNTRVQVRSIADQISQGSTVSFSKPLLETPIHGLESASKPMRTDLAPGGSFSSTKVADLSMIPPASEEEEETKAEQNDFKSIGLTNDHPLPTNTSSSERPISTGDKSSAAIKPLKELAGPSLHPYAQSSSQERFPVMGFRTETDFNKNDLRLLKKRMNDLKLKSPPPRAEIKIESDRMEKKASAALVTLGSTGASEKVESLGAEKVSPRKPRTGNAVARNQTPVKTAGASGSAGPCLRRSGCTCQACLVGTPVGTSTVAGSSSTTEEAELFPCSRCGRKFNEKSLAVHERVCAKVFSAKKQSEKKTEGESQSRKNSSMVSNSSSSGASKWRKQSQELRNAMQRGRGVSSVDSPSMMERSEAFGSTMDVSSVHDDGLIMCPHCERRFSEKAAERHIPKCSEIRSKPRTLRKGEGRTVHQAYNGSPALSAAASPSLLGRPSGSLSSGVPAGRKSLASSTVANTSTLSERGTTTVTCPDCRRRFSSKVFERHGQLCSAQSKHGVLSTSFSRPSGLRKAMPLSPASSRSSSSWDGGSYDE